MVGFLQLAGGTNAHTVDGLKKLGLFQTTSFASNLSPCFLHTFVLMSSISYFLFPSFHLSLLFLENSKDEKLTASSPSSLHALIGGIAYGGYARKVGHIYMHRDLFLCSFFNPFSKFSLKALSHYINVVTFAIQYLVKLFSVSVQIVGRVLSSMQSQHGATHIEDYPEHLLEALSEALALVGTVKCYDPF